MGFEVKDYVVIEDSAVGVQAAIAGGFAVYGFVPHGNQAHLQELGIPLFDKMDKLIPLLQ